MPDTQRIALITGANKGIGFETARAIGRKGHIILLGSRDPSRGEAAVTKLKQEGINACLLQIDVADRTTILAAANAIQNSFGKLDILVNNAGSGSPSDGPLSEAGLAEVRRLFEVNYFGALETTQAMLHLLKKATSPRIVNVSSGLGSLTRNSDPNWAFNAVQLIGYNSSKAALNMATVLLAKELKDTGIKVNSVAPGYTATDLNGGGQGAQTVEEGAQASVLAALLPDDGPTGAFFGLEGPEPW